MVEYITPCLILLADDDENDRFLFKDAIEQLDLKITLKMHSNGCELLDHLKNKKNPLPDFIFLDLHMHLKNGFEVLDELRADDRLKNLCVIIYSTSSTLEDIQVTLDKGANLYFSKSSTFQELVNRLKRIFAMDWDKFNSDVQLEKFVLVDDARF